MAARLGRVLIVGIACIILLLPTACVRSKPERKLPAVEQVFGGQPLEAKADQEPASPAAAPQPTFTATVAALPAPTDTPAAALTIVAATATAMAGVSPATATPSPAVEPSPTSSAAPLPTAALKTYVVAEGDTLFSIAKAHGTTVAALQAVNSLGASDRIKFGETIYLPADAQQSTGTTAKTTDYWVAKGENLSMIARRYKTTVDEILEANPALTNENQIYVGMHLVVPVNTAPQRTHRVLYGESLSGIAGRYGVTVRSIVQANGLRNANQIYAGQVLIIPEQ